MTPSRPSARRPARRAPRPFGALPVVLRLQLTPLRVAGVAALGGLAVLLGVLDGGDDDPLEVTARVALGTYGLGRRIPLCVLWLATSSIGDLVDDGLLVYLWLKPVPAGSCPRAAVLATGTVVVPLVVVPLVVATQSRARRS